MIWVGLVIVVILLSINKYLSMINEELRKMDDEDED